MSAGLTSWLRTIVPALWSTLVAWLVSLGLPTALTDAASGLADKVLVPVVLAVVYAGLRWLEPRLPSWLTAILLGGTVPPVYVPQVAGQHELRPFDPDTPDGSAGSS